MTEEQVVSGEVRQDAPADAQAQSVEEVRAQIEKLQNDINQQKSSFQRREHEMSSQWQQERAELQRQAAVLQQQNQSQQERLRQEYYESLPPEERQRAALQEAQQAADYYAQQAEYERQQREQVAALEQARAYRSAQIRYYTEEFGVPQDKLDLADPDKMRDSALRWLADNRTGRRVAPPRVVSPGTSKSPSRPSWKDYTSGEDWNQKMERLFKKAERGQLSEDEIPV